MAETDNMHDREQDHEITCLQSLPPSVAQTLRSRWITTVEQFVAAAATDQGRKGLETLLAEDSLVTVVEVLREALDVIGPDCYNALIQMRSGGPLGARFDDQMLNAKLGGSEEDNA